MRAGWKALMLVAALSLPAWSTLAAQDAEAAPEPAALAAEAGAGPAVAEPAVSKPAVVEPFDVEVATGAYLARLSGEEKERSDRYFEGGYWLQLWGFLYALAVAWLLLSRRISAGMRDWAERRTRFRPLRHVLYVVQYVLLTTVLFFPLTVYQGFVREHQYDLATQNFGQWMGDQGKELLVSIITTCIALVILYAVFRKAPKTWWLWGAIVSIVLLVFLILVAPVYIDPLFNEYKPLEDARVKGEILSMARASGITTDDVYQFDASRQTTRISANVSGFLNTMSIRLNDNLLERCDLDEIKAVMGHEMGHYVLNHVYESIVFIGVVLVGGFAFVRWSFDRALGRWGGRWGVRGIDDIAGLPLLGAILSVYFFVLTPVLNTYIRVNEAEADIYGLQASREPEGFAEVALKLSEYRKLDPGPVEEWIFFDHPSGRARIHMAMQWRAEHLAER
jgi:Zn-dependent protease with chaperone function